MLAMVPHFGETAAMSDTNKPFNPHTVDAHVAIGSTSPGVRVRQDGGLTTVHRASNLPNLGAVRSVPVERLEQVRTLLTDDSSVRPAGDVLADIYVALEPWL